MLELSPEEKELALKIQQLKEKAGSHSPSIFLLKEKLPELNIIIDACFLSNPYATEIFFKYLQKELIETGKLREYLEFYPSQNKDIAEFLSNTLNINKDYIFIGNGATEIIQAIMHQIVGKKIIVNLPTFSPYYEFARKDTQVIFYQLKKENNFLLDIENYLRFVRKGKPDSIVLINPNNPNGGYISYNELEDILKQVSWIENIIIDISFIHFAFEDENLSLIPIYRLFNKFKNVIFVKSMSKDFGIAGIRAGYAIMDKPKVDKLLKNGYLWNSNGLAEYFFRLYSREEFLREYEVVRRQYIKEAQIFFHELSQFEGIKVYPSKANFVLIELLNDISAEDFVAKLLIKYGIYTRIGKDKLGLNGEFVRISARTKEENEIILKAIRGILYNE